MQHLLSFLLFLSVLSLFPTSVQGQALTPPPGKTIYIPEDLRDNDFSNPESQWSWSRMAYTDNIIVLWEKGFGNDLNNPPSLEGTDMSVDIDNLLSKLEYFYSFYKDELKFVLPGSKSEQYRMMVMLNYSLEGTAYGGTYDNEIGALWIAPNRVKDKTLNCIAHELGHSFQSQIMADGTGAAWGGGGIFEMTSQWMLWNVNPNWVRDENYHWKGFIEHFHERFLAGENIYHSPYVLEYWSMKHGKTVIGDLFRGGRRGEDPAMTYMRLFNLSLDSMSLEMYDCYSRLLTFDFPRVKSTHKQFACELITPKMKRDEQGKKIFISPEKESLPGTYGFNIFELPLSAKGKTVLFEGNPTDSNTGYRYGIVLVDKDKNATYLPSCSLAKGKLKYKTNAVTYKAFMVVVGCPKEKYPLIMFNPYERNEQPAEARYDYQVIVK